MQKRYLWLMVVVLGLIVASRILVLGEIRMGPDESRSISRTFGTAQQIINWQPDDWPPLYYLVLGVFRHFAGYHPIIIRYSSVLLFALSVAMMLTVGQHLTKNRLAAIFIAAAYSSVGLVVFQSTNVRGYALGLFLLPLSFWLMLRYFATKPTWRWAVLLGVSLAALLYTTYTIVPYFGLIVLYTLVAYPRWRWWTWWRPILVAFIVAIPQLLDAITVLSRYLLEETAGRQSVSAAPALGFENTIFLLQDHAGFTWPLWIIFTVVMGAALLIGRKHINRQVGAMGILLMAAVAIAGVGIIILRVLEPRYSWWVIFPIVWLLGMSWRWLPRSSIALGVGTVLAIGVTFLPAATLGEPYHSKAMTPFEDVFSALQTAMRPDDVIVQDTSCDARRICGTPVEWGYYQQVYFPDGRLRFIEPETAQNYRRVWFLHRIDNQDRDVQKRLAEGRILSTFVGPPGFFWQLYEAPPNPEGVVFENGMRFHGFDVIDHTLQTNANDTLLVRREGEHLRVRLWWSTDEPQSNDFSVSLAIAPDAHSPAITQLDSAPQTMSLFVYGENPPDETSQWQVGDYYVEERTLIMPDWVSSDFVHVPLTLYVTLYQWWDGQPVLADETADNGRLALRELFVLGYRPAP